ncbi:hypothetical protein ZWY2020_001785 [Hordeum vulgare]|nr:hypothetical protein ZWY2020_001785 [Hordeum vulgare]
MRRVGIPHSNLCATCSRYVHVFRHRCLVCGRRCVGAGMGDITEGRKCLDCLGRKSQELLWTEQGAAPRRRPSSSSSTTSISASYNTAAGGEYSASMSMGPVPFLCSPSSCCSRLDLEPRLVTRHNSPPAPPLTAGGDGKKNTTMAARGISTGDGPAVAVVGAAPETAVSSRNG